MPRHQPPPPPPIAWDDPPRCLVTKTAFAADMRLGPSAISQYLNQGMPEGPGGMLDYTRAVAWILDNLDTTKARRTRAEAMRRFLDHQADTYTTARAGIETGAAAAYAAALSAGLPEEAAAHVADDAAARAVPLMNTRLIDDVNEPLPTPSPGIWRRAIAGATCAKTSWPWWRRRLRIWRWGGHAIKVPIGTVYYPTFPRRPRPCRWIGRRR